jgi:uncharacterized protein YecT (DUF1311 family)
MTAIKKLLTIAFLVAAIATPFAAAQPIPANKAAVPDCANANTQARLNECAYEDFLAATAGYAASYKTISDKSGTKQKDQFRRTQKLWIQYRTAACNFESSGIAGGSAQAMVKWQCDARMTRARTAELDILANCKEGDLSCPRFGK